MGNSYEELFASMDLELICAAADGVYGWLLEMGISGFAARYVTQDLSVMWGRGGSEVVSRKWRWGTQADLIPLSVDAMEKERKKCKDSGGGIPWSLVVIDCNGAFDSERTKSLNRAIHVASSGRSPPHDVR